MKITCIAMNYNKKNKWKSNKNIETTNFYNNKN